MITIVTAETSITPTNPGANVLAPNQFVGYGAHGRDQQKAQMFLLGKQLNGPER